MKPYKILIFRVSSLGDFIHATPAIKLIRKNNPGAKIYFSSQKKKSVGFVTPDLLPFQKQIIDEFIFYNNNYLSFLFFFLKIFKKKFDKLYYLNEFFTKSREKRDYLFFKTCGIKEMYGFNLKGKSSEAERYNYNKFNETYYLCRTVDKNIKNNQIFYSDIFKKNKYINKKYITISMGGRNIKKTWNFKNWKILIQKIVYKFPNLKIKIVGSKNEIPNANIIKKINKKQIMNMCGKTSVKSLFKLINLSQYHISHDDGTMHVASVYNRPGAVIFGLTAAKGKWFPLNKKQKIFYPKKNINEIRPEHIFRNIFNELKKLR
tara:strand:+ start:134 stop:1090 length:957 start_codon:yes stop_codon:yes gene_type:complete